MMDVKWAISTEIFRKPGFPQIDDALRRSNTEFFHSDFNEDTREYSPIPYDTDVPVVMYGPIKFVRTMNKGYVPGAYGFKKDTNTSTYMSMLPRDWFFNDRSIYLPWGMIMSRKDLLCDIFGDIIFIRPDSGFKSFTGFDVKMDKLEDEMLALQQLKNPSAEEMCLISSAKPIKGEFRFVVCDKQVITGSQYRWDDVLDIRIDIDHECFSFAEKVAAADWQLDACYTVDIFLDEVRGPKIGEFNSFSSSGLYNCDTDKIVEAVNRSARSVPQRLEPEKPQKRRAMIAGRRGGFGLEIERNHVCDTNLSGVPAGGVDLARGLDMRPELFLSPLVIARAAMADITIPPAALEAAKTAWYDNQHKGTDDRMASTCTAMLRAWPGMRLQTMEQYFSTSHTSPITSVEVPSIILPLPQEASDE